MAGWIYTVMEPTAPNATAATPTQVTAPKARAKPVAPREMPVVNFCFTFNNYTPETEAKLVAFLDAETTFYVYGHEVGEQGTPHLQGYMQLKKKQRPSAILKKLPVKLHLETAKGTAQQNINYCTKSDPAPVQHGECTVKGQRSDLSVATEMIVKQKATIQQVMNEHPDVFVKYHKGLLALHEGLQPKRDYNTKQVVLWIYGPAGTGKTRFAFDEFGPENVYVKDGTKWWDGYSHQKCILVDDFDGTWPFRNFLRFLDRYAFQGECKGGYLEINSPFIVVTCEFPPDHYWAANELAQVVRRLDNIVHFNA